MTRKQIDIRFMGEPENCRQPLSEVAFEMTRIALEAKRFWGYPEPWIEEWTPLLTFYPSHVASGFFWGAFEASANPRLVGFSELTPPDDEGTAGLEHMWIRPDVHGQGLGRRLFEALRARAVELQAGRLEVWSDPNAVGFYQRLGFEPFGEQHSTVQGQPRVLPVLRMSLIETSGS